MVATHERRSRAAEEPLELSLSEIPGENVLEQFRQDLRNVGLDLEMFERRVGRLFEAGTPWPMLTPVGLGPVGSVDLEDTGTDYTVKVDLPGARREGVSVTLREQVLDIRAESEQVEEAHKRSYVYKGRARTAMHRRVTFPSAVLGEKASAKLESGVLTVTVPKAKPEKELRIPLS